jgi:hypothetical protein
VHLYLEGIIGLGFTGPWEGCVMPNGTGGVACQVFQPVAVGETRVLTWDVTTRTTADYPLARDSTRSVYASPNGRDGTGGADPDTADNQAPIVVRKT